MNDLLTPLAVVGIMLFVAVVVLVGIYFAQQALTVFRLFRGGHVKVQVNWGSAPLEPPEPALPSPEPDESPEGTGDAPRGWGFDR